VFSSPGAWAWWFEISAFTGSDASMIVNPRRGLSPAMHPPERGSRDTNVGRAARQGVVLGLPAPLAGALAPASKPMSSPARWPAIDILRIVAAHLIVWHHFAIYSGMADAAWASAPEAFRALADHARKAVQVFLVVGGFFAARTLMPLIQDGDGASASPRSMRWLGRALLGRFMRLAPWVWLAIIVLLIVGRVLDGRAAAVALPVQVLANALLLQDVLGVPSLSAGLWYVAIDFQLYACVALLAWAGPRAAEQRRAMALGMVVLAILLSAWVFNREASGDVWAPYFMAAYGLGMLAWWCSQRVPGSGIAMTLATAGVSAALVFDFRDRLLWPRSSPGSGRPASSRRRHLRALSSALPGVAPCGCSLDSVVANDGGGALGRACAGVGLERRRCACRARRIHAQDRPSAEGLRLSVA
jgi:Acyltransferase family